MMNITELKSAIKFGMEAINMYKEHNEEIPNWVYERIMELQNELIERLENKE